MLTVACVWVRGHVPFTLEYVTRLETMVRAHLSEPFEFVCLTDRPWQVPAHIRTISIRLPQGLKGWWAKLELFHPQRHWPGRVLYLDLDTLIVDSLDPIVRFPAPFALVPHAGTFEGRDGLRVVKRFNSSVMVWEGGTQTRIAERWSRADASRLHGDQDWIGEQCAEAATMPLSWFPRLSEIQGPPFPADAKVILAKKPKNTIAAKRWPWFRQAWGVA